MEGMVTWGVRVVSIVALDLFLVLRIVRLISLQDQGHIAKLTHADGTVFILYLIVSWRCAKGLCVGNRSAVILIRLPEHSW